MREEVIRSHLERGWVLVSETDSKVILSRKRPRSYLVFGLLLIPGPLSALGMGITLGLNYSGPVSLIAFALGMFIISLYTLIPCFVYFLLTNKQRAILIEFNADGFTTNGDVIENMRGERIFLIIYGALFTAFGVIGLLVLGFPTYIFLVFGLPPLVGSLFVKPK